MRPGMVAFFDVGESFSLKDGAFDPARLTPIADISAVNFLNPLGRGVRVDVMADAPEVAARWRAAAVAQVRRPELPLDWSEEMGITEPEYLDRLEEYVAGHPLDHCSITVHGIGTAYLALRFGPEVDRRFLLGLLRSFEYAAYRPEVSEALRTTALDRARSALSTDALLVELTERPAASVVRDAKGQEESDLLLGFSFVVSCVDADPADDVEWLLKDWFFEPGDRLEFGHVDVYPSWWAYVLVPDGTLTTPAERERAVLRPMAALEVAHTFQGSCVWLENLVRAEVTEQVDSFGSGYLAGRSPEDLNRLRTLALAVVSLTTFSSVNQTIWERSYFAMYEQHALISEQHRRIAEACEILYGSQVAQREHDESRRQRLLNGFLLLLTSLTLISVNADAYAFVRDEDPLLSPRILRLVVLGVLLAGLAVFMYVALSRSRGPRRSSA